MQPIGRRFLPGSMAVLVCFAVLFLGMLPRSASATGSFSRDESVTAATYRVTLVSCWTNPPPSCAYGGVHAGSQFVTLIATVRPALRARLSMRIKGQRYQPGTGAIVLIKNCGQQARCTASLQTARQGASAWRFWVVILDGRGRNLLKSASINVAFLIDKPRNLELWINGAYHTRDETFAKALEQPDGTPLRLEARWRGARLDGNYWVRITNGDTMTTNCSGASACKAVGWLTCDTGTTCMATDLRTKTDGRVHRGRIYYAEMFSDNPEDHAPLLTSQSVYVNWIP